MTFITEEQKLITTDARGRVRVSDERREALLDEFERSGMSGVKFAKLVGVKYPTFALWVQKRRKARKERGGRKGEETPEGFIEAVVDGAAAVTVGGAGLTIELLGGARMTVRSPLQMQMAAELLRMIGTAGGR